MLFDRFKASDRRFSADEIFAVIQAGADGQAAVADLCASHGVTVGMYFVWKAKYGALSLHELEDVRHREHRRVRALFASLAATVVVGVSTLGLFVYSKVDQAARVVTPAVVEAPPVRAKAPKKPRPSPAAVAGDQATTGTTADRPTRVVDSRGAPQPQVVPPPGTPSRSLEPSVLATPRAPTAGTGYAVQVAAVPERRTAQAIVERLSAARHSAYLTSTTVGAIEMYRVRVGPFPSRHEAIDAARQLELEGYRDPWITR